MNYWEIEEKAASNGMHSLRVFIDGVPVKTLVSGSLKYLSQIADRVYKEEFNKHTLSGWRYSL